MIQVQTKTQDVKTFPHGFVLGEYSEESHIFDSPWYHSKLEAYGQPSEVDVAMAMEAQRRARKGVPTKAMKDLIDILVAGASKGVDDVKEVKENKEVNGVEEVIVGIPLAAPVSPVVEKGVSKAKTNTKTKSKAKANPVTVPTPPINALSPICKEVSKDTRFVESMDDPIEVELITIVLKKFEHGGDLFWRDDERGTLYERMTNGKKGECIGRWDSVEGCIVDV
jgi:hypothetical protein